MIAVSVPFLFSFFSAFLIGNLVSQCWLGEKISNLNEGLPDRLEGLSWGFRLKLLRIQDFRGKFQFNFWYLCTQMLHSNVVEQPKKFFAYLHTNRIEQSWSEEFSRAHNRSLYSLWNACELQRVVFHLEEVNLLNLKEGFETSQIKQNTSRYLDKKTTQTVTLLRSLPCFIFLSCPLLKKSWQKRTVLIPQVRENSAN